MQDIRYYRRLGLLWTQNEIYIFAYNWPTTSNYGSPRQSIKLLPAIRRSN